MLRSVGYLYAQFRCSARKETPYPWDNLLLSRSPRPHAGLPSRRFFSRPGEGRMAVPKAISLSLPTAAPAPHAWLLHACPRGWCCSARWWQRVWRLTVLGWFFWWRTCRIHVANWFVLLFHCAEVRLCVAGIVILIFHCQKLWGVWKKRQSTVTYSLKRRREISENANSWATNDWVAFTEERKISVLKKTMLRVGIF